MIAFQGLVSERMRQGEFFDSFKAGYVELSFFAQI